METDSTSPEGDAAMRVTYDEETDTLTIALRSERIKGSDEVRPGVIADFGYNGGIVRFEILHASKVVEKAREIQFRGRRVAIATWLLR